MTRLDFGFQQTERLPEKTPAPVPLNGTTADFFAADYSKTQYLWTLRAWRRNQHHQSSRKVFSWIMDIVKLRTKRKSFLFFQSGFAILNGDIAHLSAFTDHFRWTGMVERFAPGKLVCQNGTADLFRPRASCVPSGAFFWALGARRLLPSWPWTLFSFSVLCLTAEKSFSFPKSLPCFIRPAIKIFMVFLVYNSPMPAQPEFYMIAILKIFANGQYIVSSDKIKSFRLH